MAKKIIQLHNGRIKRTGNRIGGDTSSIDSRYRRRDNEHRAHLRHQQFNLDARQAIEECDMIGPRGIINKNSSDYPAQEPRRNQSKRRNSRRRNNDSNNNQCNAQHYAAPITMVTTVVAKKSRPAIKVIIDEGGTMRAIPLV
ncbi:MAG: hypothetical protein WC028_22930 [Candidatus Obscuribacterales bacterium]|jgi:hypothetical protein